MTNQTDLVWQRSPLLHEPQHDLELLAVLEKGHRPGAASTHVLAGAPDDRGGLLPPGLGDCERRVLDQPGDEEFPAGQLILDVDSSHVGKRSSK